MDGVVGVGVARVDGLDKVLGRAVYGVDVDLPGMATSQRSSGAAPAIWPAALPRPSAGTRPTRWRRAASSPTIRIVEFMSGNLCRCTGYADIVSAIALAARAGR